VRETGTTPEELEGLLNSRSGLKGLCGSNDLREIIGLMERGNTRARLAVEMFCYRIKKYIGAYLAVLGRAEAVVFTGGIGENAPVIRQKICDGLEGLGIGVDEGKNRASLGSISEIQRDGLPLKVLVIKTDEELEIARQTIQVIEQTAASNSG